MKPFHLGALAWSALVAVCLFVATRQPWIGVKFESAPEAPGLRVTSVAPAGPAQGRLNVGDHITAILDADGATLALNKRDITVTASAVRSYEELAEHLRRQDQIAQIVRRGAITFLTAQGAQITLATHGLRPWTDLPAVFWLQVLAMPAIAIAILSVLLLRQSGDLATRYFAVCIACFALLVAAHGVYSTRELGLSQPLYRILLAINLDATLILALGAAPAFIWNYPAALGSQRVVFWMLGLSIVFALLHEMRMWPNLNIGFRGGLFMGAALQSLICIWQWRRARRRPAHRAVLKWLIVPWFGGLVLYYLLFFIPASAGHEVRAPQFFGWVLLLIVVLGLAFGLSRFRLYYLNQANLLVWFADGLMVMSLAFALLQLGLMPFLAACLALTAAGALHGKIQEFVWARQGLRYAEFERVLRIVLTELGRCHGADEVISAWQRTLRILFDPLTIEAMPEGLLLPRLESDGEWLLVPSAASTAGLKLYLPYRGRGLFMPEDVALVRELGRVFDTVARYWSEHQAGERQERRRLAQQLERYLHHSLAPLETQASRAELRQLALEARNEIRRVVSALLSERCLLDEALSEWREEIQQRCRPAGIEARISAPESAPDERLDVSVRFHVQGIIREVVSNTIRHSGASLFSAVFTLAAAPPVLHMTLEDNGVWRPEDITRRGGLNNMQRRAHALAAELQLDRGALGGLRVRLRLPVPRTGDSLPDPGPLGSTQ